MSGQLVPDDLFLGQIRMTFLKAMDLLEAQIGDQLCVDMILPAETLDGIFAVELLTFGIKHLHRIPTFLGLVVVHTPIQRRHSLPTLCL